MIDRAIELAAQAHRGQMRKGTDIPYIAHPYAVGMMLARAGMSDEIVTAGLLHDTVEDTYLTLEDIEEEFGEQVAAIVEGCSEHDKSEAWEVRKEHTLRFLRTAPWDVRIVACADKVHNLGTVREALAEVGESAWGRFKRGRAEQERYYRGLVESLGDGIDGRELPFYDELKTEVDRVFGNSSAGERSG